MEETLLLTYVKPIKKYKTEKRFKITPKEIRLLRYWSKEEKISQSRFVELAIEEFLNSIKS